MLHGAVFALVHVLMPLSLSYPSRHTAARVAGMATLTLAVLVLVGWHLKIPAIIQIRPEFVPMQYNTALGFLLAGIGLLAASGSHCRVATMAGSLVGVIGLLSLAEHLSGVDLGIDQLFMQHYITVSTPQPGRMAPNTALCFTLAGVALLLAGLERCSGRRRLAVSLLSALIAGLGTVAFTGYLVGIPTAYGWGNLTRMAAHTSLGFMIFGSGLIALAWQTEASGHDWRPWALGVVGATITVALWQAIKAAEVKPEGLAAEFVLVFGLAMAIALGRSVAATLRARRAADTANSATARLGREMDERNKAEDTLQRFFALIPDLLCIVSIDGRFLKVNPAWQATLGYTEQEMLSAPFIDLVHPDDKGATIEKMARLVAGEATTGFVNRYRCKDGSYRLMEWAATPAVGALLFAAARDITERKLQEQQLRDLNANLEARVRRRTEDLEQANKELGAFSYSISHDLRAPLRALDGFARILSEDEAPRLSPEGRRMLERISANAEKMSTLIDDVLHFSRVSRVELQRADVDMAALAGAVVDELHAEYPEAEVSVAELPHVSGDASMLRQVWENLIGNAFKFSSKTEKPRIAVGTLDLQGRTVFFVWDNGAGIDMTYSDKLFQVFQRMHSDKEFPGTGAGLAIVKRIIERHDGHIWAESHPNSGATFYFTLGG